ncbi:MAG TPA: c-type cytochrome [Mycobacteriales bacterium]
MTDAPASDARRRRRRRLPALVYLVLALAATAGGWALFAPTSHASGNDTVIAQGKQLFAEGCSACHGLSGQGVQGVAPSLVGVGGAAVDFQVSTGRMPLSEPGIQAASHTARYTQAQIDALAAYVQSLGGGPAQVHVTQAMIDQADVPLGGEIFRANCASCHNYAGTGNSLDKGRYAPNLGRATPTQIYEAMATGPEAMPIFSNRLISDQEKVDVAAYILSLRKGHDPGGANLGHVGPVPEGLVIFVVGIGALVGAAVWIGARNR